MQFAITVSVPDTLMTPETTLHEDKLETANVPDATDIDPESRVNPLEEPEMLTDEFDMNEPPLTRTWLLKIVAWFTKKDPVMKMRGLNEVEEAIITIPRVILQLIPLENPIADATTTVAFEPDINQVPVDPIVIPASVYVPEAKLTVPARFNVVPLANTPPPTSCSDVPAKITNCDDDARFSTTPSDTDELLASTKMLEEPVIVSTALLDVLNEDAAFDMVKLFNECVQVTPLSVIALPVPLQVTIDAVVTGRVMRTGALLMTSPPLNVVEPLPDQVPPPNVNKPDAVNEPAPVMVLEEDCEHEAVSVSDWADPMLTVPPRKEQTLAAAATVTEPVLMFNDPATTDRPPEVENVVLAVTTTEQFVAFSMS